MEKIAKVVVLLMVCIFIFTSCTQKIPVGVDKQLWLDSKQVYQIVDKHFKNDKPLSNKENEILNNYTNKYFDKYYLHADVGHMDENELAVYNLIIAQQRAQDYFKCKERYDTEAANSHKKAGGYIIQQLKDYYK